MTRSRRIPRGFSMTEMLVASLIGTVLGATAYKVLTSNTRFLVSEVRSSAQTQRTIEAFHQFRRDLAGGNPVWSRQGVSSVYPHPGLGPAGNMADVTGPFDPGTVAKQSDAVTFLKTHPKKRQIFEVARDFTLSPQTDWVTVAVQPATASNLAAGDVVLVYQNRQYALMKVETLSPGGDAEVSALELRRLDPSYYLDLKKSNDTAAGFVATQAGPAPCGGFDCGWGGYYYDDDPGNDSATFTAGRAFVEPVVVASYQVRYVSSAGAVESAERIPAEGTIGPKGNQTYLVRRTWSNVGKGGATNDSSAVLVPVRNLRIAYSVSQSVDMKGNLVLDSLAEGVRSDQILSDVGLTYAPTDGAVRDPLDLRLYFNRTAPNRPGDPGARLPHDAYRIVAVSPRISLADAGGRARDYQMSVAVTQPAMRVGYQDPLMTVNVTERAETARAGEPCPFSGLVYPYKSCPKPPYDNYSAEAGQPAVIDYGDGELDVVVPMSFYHFSDPAMKPEQLIKTLGEGTLVVYGKDGRPANGSLSDSALRLSSEPYSGRGTLYPSSVTLGRGNPPFEMYVNSYRLSSASIGNLSGGAADRTLHATLPKNWDETLRRQNIDDDPTGRWLRPSAAWTYIRWPRGMKFRQALASGLTCTLRDRNSSSNAANPLKIWPKLDADEPGCAVYADSTAEAPHLLENSAGSLVFEERLYYSYSARAPAEPLCGSLATPTPPDLEVRSFAMGQDGHPVPGYNLSPGYPSESRAVIPRTGPTATAANQVIARISTRPIRVGSAFYVGVAVTNHNDGKETCDTCCNGGPCTNPSSLAYTGAIYLVKLPFVENPSDNSVFLLATHNLATVSGIEGFGGGVAVGGRIAVQFIPEEVVAEAVGGRPFTPPRLQLDEIEIREGRIRYADGFQVWPEAIDAESAAKEQVIGGIAGMSAARIDPMNFHVVLANKRWGSFSTGSPPKPGLEYWRDLSVTRVAVGGSVARAIASIQKAPSANLNEAKVRVRRMRSEQSASFSTIPPGAFLSRGERTAAFRLSPQPARRLCDGKKPLPAPDFGSPDYERDWINYRREMLHPNGPAPGPGDALAPLPPPASGPIPGNCRCDAGCMLPCSSGPFENPLTEGPAGYGFGCSVEKMGETCLYPAAMAEIKPADTTPAEPPPEKEESPAPEETVTPTPEEPADLT